MWRDRRRVSATVVVELLGRSSYCPDTSTAKACATTGGQRRPAKATCVAADMAAAKVSAAAKTADVTATADSASAASRSRPNQLSKPYESSAC
jgi:hypothetical protein